MGKTPAERQREYRERKKLKEGDSYLAKETERVKKYYIKSSELSAKKLATRRKKVRECMQQKRLKIKIMNSEQQLYEGQVNTSTEEAAGPCDSTGIDASLQSTPAGPSQLTVKMQFPAKKRRRSKALSKANKEIRRLRDQVKNMRRKRDVMKKRLERMSKKRSNNNKNKNNNNINNNNVEHLTPDSKANAEVSELHMTPNSRKKIKKKLKFHNTIISEIKSKVGRQNGKSKQRDLLKVVCGKVLNKYRLERTFGKETGVQRKQIKKTISGVKVTKQRQRKYREGIKQKVVEFLERDDNSICLPGKKDATKDGSKIKQTRILNDYLFNLHMKFQAENTEVKISLSVFTRLRPLHVKLVKFSSRKTCLCQKHQNMALKVKVLKTYGVTSTENPDTLVKTKTDDELIQEIENIQNDKITFLEWKRVDVEKKDRTIKRMQMVTIEKSKEEFKNIFSRELTEFRKHIERVRIQYAQSRKLKEELQENHIICHMDFAENYSCGFPEEVQSAYFDKGSVTLHPVVLYYKENGELKHKSYVFVSDETAHTSSTVYGIIKKIIPEVTTFLPNVKMIHYMTDSPTSQYRNQHIFGIISQHDSLFPNIKSSWLYFEAGHGKGVCDGVGGTAKRNADMAVKRQIAVIQSASDFYEWGRTQENSNLKYMFVSKSDCQAAVSELEIVKTKAVKGTLRVHAVVSRGMGRVAVRSTSCYCNNCFTDGEFQLGCEGWIEHQVIDRDDNIETVTDETTSDMEVHDDVANEAEPVDADQGQGVPAFDNTVRYPEGAFVAAVYESQWYMGQITQYDPSDNEYNINFMCDYSSMNLYKWPKEPDQVWIPCADIICRVNEPVRQGRTRSAYRFDCDEIDKVKALFK